MSRSSNLSQPLGPLSVGNVVSAGLRIYRDRFKLYYGLALQASLWLFVPVYGWAKYSAIQGLIARLAFHEAMERPETVQEARSYVNPRMWSFFLAGFLVNLILLVALLGMAIVAGVFIGIAVVISQGNTAASVALGIIAFLILLVLLFCYIWLYSRLSIVELPIAVESQSDATVAIGRSWNLTKGFVVRLVIIFFVAFLITIPLYILVNLISISLQNDSPSPAAVVINLAISVLGGALFIPFWQAIKAIIYYDLRSRKEGLGLEIKDSLNEE